jgi:hypothetical protein
MRDCTRSCAACSNRERGLTVNGRDRGGEDIAAAAHGLDQARIGRVGSIFLRKRPTWVSTARS